MGKIVMVRKIMSKRQGVCERERVRESKKNERVRE